jgi:hypothetical protein
VSLRESLRTLRLAQFNSPSIMEPLKTVPEVAAALRKDKDLIKGYDVEAEFAREVSAFESAARAGLDEGHAHVNGRWLVDVFAPRRQGASETPQRCREQWTTHAITSGGLPEVLHLWARITRRPP